MLANGWWIRAHWHENLTYTMRSSVVNDALELETNQEINLTNPIGPMMEMMTWDSSSVGADKTGQEQIIANMDKWVVTNDSGVSTDFKFAHRTTGGVGF
jgi:hypothetical protein